MNIGMKNGKIGKSQKIGRIRILKTQNGGGMNSQKMPVTMTKRHNSRTTRHSRSKVLPPQPPRQWATILQARAMAFSQQRTETEQLVGKQ